MEIKFSHTPYPQELSTHAKDMAFERALKSAQNTHMRYKLVVFGLQCSSMCTNLFISMQIRKIKLLLKI